MKVFVTLLAVVIMSIAVGCSKPKEEGPAEKAGRQVDEAMEKAQAYTSEKMKEMGQAMERAGEEVKEKK